MELHGADIRTLTPEGSLYIMQKHIQLVGILNIVYRSLLILVAILLLALSAWFVHIVESILWHYDGSDIPSDILELVPMILVVVAALLFLFSVIGIVGAIGVLQKKEWGRIVTLVISFLNLLHIPFGTALGVYSIWALMKDETVRMFNPTQGGQLSQMPQQQP